MKSLQPKAVSDKRNLEELSWQVTQLQERMNELDRAISALSQLVASSTLRKDEQAEETDGSDRTKYVDEEALKAIQSLMDQLQQENERLLGTVAHISHEIEVNTEHVKVGVACRLMESRTRPSGNVW